MLPEPPEPSPFYRLTRMNTSTPRALPGFFHRRSSRGRSNPVVSALCIHFGLQGRNFSVLLRGAKGDDDFVVFIKLKIAGRCEIVVLEEKSSFAQVALIDHSLDQRFTQGQLSCHAATLQNVLSIHTMVRHDDQLVIQVIHEYCLNDIELGWVQKHVATIRSAVIRLARPFARKNDQILVELNDVTHSRTTAERSAIEKPNILRIDRVY